MAECIDLRVIPLKRPKYPVPFRVRHYDIVIEGWNEHLIWLYAIA